MATKKRSKKKAVASKGTRKASTAARSGRSSQATSFKDVQLSYLMNGESGLEQLKSSGVSRNVFRRALGTLKASGQSTGAFERWFTQSFGAITSGGRGRRGPQAGDRRDYKTQQIGDTEEFIRLPLSVLGVKKGDLVSVAFDSGAIRVSRPATGHR
jgi:hypothetical protein